MMQYRSRAYANSASANYAEASFACPCAAMTSESSVMLIMDAMMASIIVFVSMMVRSMIALLVLGLVGIIVLLGLNRQFHWSMGWA